MATPKRSPQPPLDPVDKTVVRDVLRKIGTDAPADRVVDELAHAGIEVSAQQVDSMKGRDSSSTPAEAAEHDGEWRRHEHVSATASAQARELLERAGSPELAKQAIDDVAEHGYQRPASGHDADENTAGDRVEPRQQLADELGYASYEVLVAASTPVTSQPDAAWFATPCRREWVVWNDREFTVRDRFSSREEAVASLTALGKP